MFQIKNFSAIAILAIAGILLISIPVFSHGASENSDQCGQYTFNTDQLTKEQAEKIDQINVKYSEKTLSLRQELNLLKTKAYNYSLNEKIDLNEVKGFRQKIRDVRGKLDDLRIDELAEINKVLPEDQQINFEVYLNQYTKYSTTEMMNSCKMMDNMSGKGSHGMMGNMMQMSDNNMIMNKCSKMRGSDESQREIMMGDKSKRMMNCGMMSQNTGSDSDSNMNDSDHESHH
ncbi:MAG: hypothetical protein IPM14_15445 [bacterium]|nr:hypothetical protein [bacterium]